MNYNLTPGISLDDRKIYFSIPSGTTISAFKKIVETDNTDNYIAEDIVNGVSRGYYHYINSDNQEVFGIFYSSDGTSLSNIRLPEDFGTIVTIDDTSVLYEYISRTSHEKVYVTSEDFAKKESLGKDDIVSEIEDQVATYGVPVNTVMGFDGQEADIPEGFELTDETFGGGGGEADKVGVIKLFSGTTAPDNWLICDGSAVSRETYSDLFSVIGTTYGNGDGSTTFNLPNLKGKTVVGLDSSDTDFNTIGKTGGSKELQEHTHNNRMDTLNNLDQSYGLSSNGVYADRVVIRSNNINSNTLNNQKNIQDTGTGNAGNLQPYIVLNFIIKANATTPTQGQIVDSLDSDSTTDAPSIHAVNSLIKTSNNGNVLKFDNGLMIITQKIAVNTNISTSWQGHYITLISPSVFPVEFTNLLSCTLTLESTNSKNAWLMTNELNTPTKAGTVYIISPENISNFQGNINIMAIGTYK